MSGSASVSARPVLFSFDNKYAPRTTDKLLQNMRELMGALRCRLAFVASGDDVYVFATATGEQCATLRGHTAAVSGIAIHNENSQCIITSSLDGTRTPKFCAVLLPCAWH